jgi:hypothetical protein
MKIIDHGAWVRCEPKKLKGLENFDVMFSKRTSDGADWYEFVAGNAFTSASIKMTVHEGIVQAVSRDASRLFPQNCRVIELVGDPAHDVHARYHGMVYDEKALSLSAAPTEEVEPLPDLKELLARVEALEKKRGDAAS